MYSYLIIWLSSLLFLFPKGDRIEAKSLYSLVFTSFIFAHALLGFFSLLLIVLGISKFPLLIIALSTLFISVFKIKNSKNKLLTYKKFLINEIKSFFDNGKQNLFQKFLSYLSLILIITIFISSIGPINHPDAADYHVGYPFQYYLRGKFFVDGGFHQGLIGIADYANLAFIQEKCVWLIRSLQIINLPILILFLSKNCRNNIYLIAFLSISTFIQWSTIGKPLFLGESSLIVVYLLWKETKSILTLKLLAISVLNCIGFKVSSLLIILPILIDFIINLFYLDNRGDKEFRTIREIFSNRSFILSIFMILSLLISRYAIVGNFFYPVFTNIFNSNNNLIIEFSNFLRKFGRDDFFYIDLFIPTKISDIGQSLGPFTLLLIFSYFYNVLRSFRLKKDDLFWPIVMQLSFLLLFCQGRSDYYLAPILLLFYEVGKIDPLKDKLTIKIFSYSLLFIQTFIVSIFLFFSIFLNFNTAIAYEKNMKIAAYGYESSLLVDKTMQGNILFNERNTRLYYPKNYLDKDKLNICINEKIINGKKDPKENCLTEFNITQIVNASEDIVKDEKNYFCQDLKLTKATRNPLKRTKYIKSYCKKRNLIK